MKGTKGLFRSGVIASSMVLMIALSLMVLAGCGDPDPDPDPTPTFPSYSLAVSGEATGTTGGTLTLTLTGATWDEGEASGSGIVSTVYDVTFSGDIAGVGYVDFAAAVSNGDKTLTLTVSKSGSNTGTITFTPKASTNSNSLGPYTSIGAGGVISFGIPITGSAVTFTIN